MIEQIGAALVSEDWSAEDVLRWAFLKFNKNVAIASAFGAEGMVLIDIASRVFPDLRVFTLDTGFLFPETYDLMTRVERHYGIKIEKVCPQLSPQEQECQYGPALWGRDADQCCNLRKVEPLRCKLAELRAWITAIRRDQTTVRAKAHKLQWDSNFQLYKINPLVDWTAKQVWRHIQEHHVPYNPLHDRGYPSIGCTHCTRAVMPGHDPRSGRWPDLEKKECGLHVICQ
jgi:phosphoadenosine phosphosulfate reductase